MKRFCLLVLICLLFSVSGFAETTYTGKNGMYADLGGRSEPNAVGGEFGYATYVTENLSYRGGLSFLTTEETQKFFGGVNLGMRFNLNFPLSPFVGVGAFAGTSKREVSAESDEKDNDDDGLIDERGEIDEEIDGIMASVYPEVGVHIWTTKNSRLTISGKYHVTSEGREHDFWLYSAGISFFFD